MGPENTPTHRASYGTGLRPRSVEPLPLLAEDSEDRALDLAAGRGVHEPEGHLADLDQVVGVDTGLGGRGAAGGLAVGGGGWVGNGDGLVSLGLLELGGE